MAEPSAPLTSLPADVHVKEDSWVLGIGGLGCRGWMGHLHCGRWKAGHEYLVRERGSNSTAPLRPKLATRRRAHFLRTAGSRALVSGDVTFRFPRLASNGRLLFSGWGEGRFFFFFSL